MPERGQIELFKGAEAPHVVVATPGRIKVLANKGHVKIDKLNHFVLDECDRLLEDLDKSGDTLIDAADTLIVMGEFLPGFPGVAQKVRDRHFIEFVENFIDSFVGFTIRLVAEEIGFEFALCVLILAATTVRI